MICYFVLTDHCCSWGAYLKSEAYIDAFLKGKKSMYDAHVKTYGGYISGEVKLDVTLCLLAGGNALALGVIFDIIPGKINTITFSVLRNWVKKPNIGGINMHAYLNNNNAMENVSIGFSQRSRCLERCNWYNRRLACAYYAS